MLTSAPSWALNWSRTLTTWSWTVFWANAWTEGIIDVVISQPPGLM